MTVPALVVSGFLGSGKTTVVGQLLRQAQESGLRLAIISNEFGDTGIDRALLDSGQDGFVELDGGCVCCKLSDALGETVEAIVRKSNPDRLILETSGVALPGEIVLNFWRPPASDVVADTAVAVVVDAARLDALGDDETFLDQIQAADLVILNKCDLVDVATRRAAVLRLAELTGGQPVLESSHGKVPLQALFPPDPTPRRPARPHADDHHHERFETHRLERGGTRDPDELLDELRALGAIRVKGFVRTAEGVKVVQGVGPRIELSDPVVSPPEELVGTIVVIDRARG